ncbi:MAG: tyrosine-type recombinase/integrase, partial [Gelidibacter sp.]
MTTITLTPLYHHHAEQIAIGFKYEDSLKSIVKNIHGVLWSQTHQTFYVKHDSHTVNRLFGYFKSKGYYVDYSSLKASKVPAVPLPVARPRKAMGIDGKVLYTALPLSHKELLKRYAAYLRGKRLSEQTVRSYGHFVLRFLHYTKDRRIDLLRTEHIDNFMSDVIAKEQYGISSHRQCVSAFKYLTQLCKLRGFDASTYKRPKKSKYLPTVLSKEEVIDLLRASNNLKHRAIIGLLYSCGLRIGELLNLKKSDLDFDRQQLYIRNGKGRKDRVVGMSAVLQPLLMNYLHTYAPTVFVIEGSGGGPYSAVSVRHFLKRNCQRLGIKKQVTPHTLRHSYATHMLENGVDVRYIQELLGHSKPETTMIYTHVAQRDLMQIRNPLDVTVEQITKNGKEQQNVLLSRNYKE